MNTTVDITRDCTISESIKQSCKQVKLMREGKLPKPTLNDLFADIEIWKNED
jgi:hypothetical protein